MTAREAVLRVHGNSYNIFILVLTVYSLALMGVLLLPLDQDTRDLVNLYDNAICVIFLIDFAYNVTGARPKNGYLVGQRGWIDLLGSIPSFTFFPAAGLLRMFRVFRLTRIMRIFRGQNQKQIVADVLHNRGQYATFITILLAGMVLSVASILVLQFESRSPGANITTGGDALWWAIVTITTVGYGDFYPTTALGRITGVFVMFSGVGIIGALASILASMLVAPSSSGAEAGAAQEGAVAAAPAQAAGGASAPTAAAPAVTAAAAPAAPAAGRASADGVAAELASLRAEIAALRGSLERGPG
jgi:voltage-gated potassium channel